MDEYYNKNEIDRNKKIEFAFQISNNDGFLTKDNDHNFMILLMGRDHIIWADNWFYNIGMLLLAAN